MNMPMLIATKPAQRCGAAVMGAREGISSYPPMAKRTQTPISAKTTAEPDGGMVEHCGREDAEDDRQRLSDLGGQDNREKPGLVPDLGERDEAGRNEGERQLLPHKSVAASTLR
jgi:hypothetical protein